ncbi:taste receptor type 2 member 40-like [Pelodytes ibericus]
MLNILEMTHLIICIVSGLFAFILNSWIVAVNIQAHRAGVPMSPCDQILTLLGCTNLALQTLEYLGTYFKLFSVSFTRFQYIHVLFVDLTLFLISCIFWLTLWLFWYYCLRIVHFKRGILYMLKMRISTLMPKLLWFSFVESILNTILAIWNVSVKDSPDLYQNTTDPSTISVNIIYTEFNYYLFILLLCAVSIFFTLIPIGLTMISLRRHTKKMRKKDFSLAQMQAHLTAIKTMVLLTVLYISFYVASISLVLHSFNVETVSEYLSWYCVLVYPMLQSMVIISGNSRLRKAVTPIQNHIRNYCWKCALC